MSHPLPIIHAVTERAEGPGDRVLEELDLEFSNGEGAAATTGSSRRGRARWWWCRCSTTTPCCWCANTPPA